jgi:hypothetical protein
VSSLSRVPIDRLLISASSAAFLRDLCGSRF